MGKRKGRELSIQDRGIIIGMLKAKVSVPEIAKEMKCGKRTIYYIKSKFSQTGSVENRPRSGRPRCTTERQERNIKYTSLSNRKLGAKDDLKKFIEIRGSTSIVKKMMFDETP